MIHLFRRTFLLGASALALTPIVKAAAAEPVAIDFAADYKFPFAVPALPYGYDANEPAIDTQTMQLHHDKHHAAYVGNLNKALEEHPDLQAKSLTELLAHVHELPEGVRGAVRNNAGGHANHTMFWQIMGGKGGDPMGELADAIIRDFGSLAKFREDVDKGGLRVFGSGWTMVLVDGEGKLSLMSRPNQESPLMEGKRVLFGNDVWEHAYYLKYQNRRADYLKAWWSVLDWSRIGARYAAAKAGKLTI